MNKFPAPVVIIVGEELGSFYYNHRRIESLFAEKGAPGEPPQGNCVDKCKEWLKRAGDDPNVDAFALLGGVLEEYMEVDGAGGVDNRQANGRERIARILQRHGLSYQQGGRIVGATVALPTRSLEATLRNRDLPGLEIEFRRALENVEKDPPAAITAACSILESLFQIYIESENLGMPSEKSILPLWRAVRDHIGFDPQRLEDDDLKKVLQGLASLVDGIGCSRTHAGSAHGRGRKRYDVRPRHARLAVHAAHTLAMFIIETWEVRKQRE